MPEGDLHTIYDARRRAKRVATTQIGPGEATLLDVTAGSFVRIMVLHRPQVGELRLWARNDLSRRLSTEIVRQRVGAHVTVGAELVTGEGWPAVLASVSGNSVSWYGYDNDNAGVHDVLGSPCEHRSSPLVAGFDPKATCRGSMERALADATATSGDEMRPFVGSGVGVFVCSGIEADTGRYFSKSTPARGGDYLEIFAHEALLVGVSACPVGDGTEPADVTGDGRLRIDIIAPET